jgi:hypothetical protein
MPNIPEIRSMFFKTLKLYNKKRKKCAKKIKEAALAKLDDLRSSDPQAYWKLLKSLKDNSQSGANDISMEDWVMHFQNLNNSATDNSSKNSILKKLQQLEKQKDFNEMNFIIKENVIMKCIKK